MKFISTACMFVVLLTVLSGAQSAANDSAASIVAGGIVLENNEDIRLVREDLFVSLDKINVDYIFANPTDRDVTLTMAFPFPDTFADDIDGQWPDHAEDVKFIDFATTLNGVEVKANEVVEIIDLDGNDITDIFRREGFPLAPYADAYRAEKYFGDDPAVVAMKERMIALGLLGNSESRKWKVRISYVWQATFPAQSQVNVSHSYKPISGAFFLALEDAAADRDSNFATWFRERFCAGDATIADLRTIPASARYSLHVRELGYVLKTGANWAGTIDDFRLVIDKGRPDNQVITCWSGALTPSGPTTLTFSAQNYIPEQDLILAIMPDDLFVRKASETGAVRASTGP